MAGRHSAGPRSTSRALPAFLVVLSAMIIGVGGFVVVGNASKTDPTGDGCLGSVPVRLAAATEMAPVLEQATEEIEREGAEVDGACIDFQVQPGAPAQVASALSAQPQQAPHLWVPDSSLWLTRAAASGATPAVLSKSTGLTPVVLAAAGATQPASWLEVGKDKIAFLDPLTSSASSAALLAVHSESSVTGATQEELGSMMVPLAQRYGADPNKPKQFEDVVNAAAKGVPSVMTEQQVVSLQAAGNAATVTAVVPKTGTLVLDYPLAALSPEPLAKEAGGKLALFMAGERGAELLAEAGFRNTQNQPLASGEGLGKKTITVLSAPEADTVESSLRQWAVLTVPSRALAVFDVSGSMDFVEGGRTRISLAVEAAQMGLQQFPDTAQIGVWGFSIGLGGGNRDYRQLVPIRRLSASTRDGVQRDVLAGAINQLPYLTNGGTGLYDTTLAAIRTVQDNYDPRSINSVILLTDGENEDPGSLSMRELLQTIERERDPARPVVVIGIGMGPEADEAALRRIAAATGGRSYVARNSSDIMAVFRDALLSR